MVVMETPSPSRSVKTPSPTWQQQRVLHRQAVGMAQSMEKTRARAAFNEEAAEGVVMEVSDKADLKAIDKYHQADASMHTLEAWERRRFALRRDKDVRQALHLWWTAAHFVLFRQRTLRLRSRYSTRKPISGFIN